MNPLVLIILDGWGIASASKGNAISLARTPWYDKLWESSPHSILSASEKDVGLPKRIRGNSEAGHLNLGAGRIVLQDSYYISLAITTGEFFRNPVFLKAIEHTRKNNSDLHLIGLLSGEQTAHSAPDHLFALLVLARIENIKNVFIHLFLDGRDSPPKSALYLLEDLQKHINAVGLGKISSLCGRYYAMDRAANWLRTEKAYNLLTEGEGEKAENFYQAVKNSYKKGIYDEFVEPTVLNHSYQSIKDNDAVIFFNLRSDRARHLTKAFILEKFDFFKRKNFLRNLYFVAMTDFGVDLLDKTAFFSRKIENALPKVLAEKGLRQLYIAETEKFAHVTYFFHGSDISSFLKENRILVPSVKCETYDQIPQMSAWEITNVVLNSLENKLYDFILVNFANPDMLGHTGNIQATIKGLEFVDLCLEKITKKTLGKGGIVVVTADHGNAEEMINPETGEIDTQHSLNPVPFIIKQPSNNSNLKLKEKGILANVAPTILDLLQIEKPKEVETSLLLNKNL